MTAIVYIAVFFFLIILQTTVLPSFAGFFHLYDMIIILVVYLGFYSDSLKGFPAVIIMGFLMDCFTGGAFGVYITTYLWLFSAVSILIRFLHVASNFLLVSAIVAGVIFENLVVFMTIALGTGEISSAGLLIGKTMVQVLLSIVTGPIIFYIIKAFHEACDSWFKAMIKPKDQKSDF